MREYINKVQKICDEEFGWLDGFKIVYDGDYPVLLVKYGLDSDNNPEAVSKIINRIKTELNDDYKVYTCWDADHEEFDVMPGKNFTWPESKYIETEFKYGNAEYESIAG